jgi:hypothetical protein
VGRVGVRQVAANPRREPRFRPMLLTLSSIHSRSVRLPEN